MKQQYDSLLLLVIAVRIEIIAMILLMLNDGRRDNKRSVV